MNQLEKDEVVKNLFEIIRMMIPCTQFTPEIKMKLMEQAWTQELMYNATAIAN